jgi:hypothetical protein
MSRAGKILAAVAEAEYKFLQRGQFAPPAVKDYNKSQGTKRGWNRHYQSHVQGLRDYHDSPEGKEDHKQLGRFLQLRSKVQKSSLVKALNALKRKREERILLD